MKRVFFISLLCVFALMAARSAVFALEKDKPVPDKTAPAEKTAPCGSRGEWLAGEMPLNNWLAISESERIKIARGFADDYYEMDKSCNYAKIKAYYDEKKKRAYIYVECVKRNAPAFPEKVKPI
ncbi:MAG: hypothetical protein ACE14T_03660 [Syntrophales bacterium]